MNNTVSFLNNIREPANFSELDLSTSLELIKGDTYKQRIIKLRSVALTDKEAYKKGKIALPSIHFNGRFKDSITNDNFIESSGLFHFDIDNLNPAHIEEEKAEIASIPECVFCFVSPGGNGLKGALKVDPELVKNDYDFKNVYSFMEAFFIKFGHTIDTACKDVRRACFVSYDPNIYINYEAYSFDLKSWQKNVATVLPTVLPISTYTPVVYNDKQAQKNIDQVLNILLKAKDGDKHSCRLRAAKLAGGFIANGSVDESEIRAAMLMVSNRISATGETTKSELKTLDDGIEYGKKTPVCQEKEFKESRSIETDIIEKKSKLSIEAYPGAMQLLVDEILRIANKKQPELSVLSALIGMTAAIGGNYKGPDGSRFNLYGVGFAGTGEGKDKPMLAAIETSAKAGARIGGKPQSGAAMEDMLEETNSKILLNIDEIALTIEEMNDPKNVNMKALSVNLLKLFSASRNTYYTRALARSNNSEQRACVNPAVSLLGFACPDTLGKAFGNGGNVNDGFMGRVLWANGIPNPPHLRSRGEFTLPDHVKNICVSLSHTKLTQVTIDSDADLLLDEMLEEFQLIGNSSTNPFEHDLKKRSFEKTERVAGVLAIWDDPIDPVIMPCHVEWAANFVRYSDYTVLSFTEKHMHGGETQANAAKVMDIIDKFNKGKLKATTKPHKKILKEGYYPRSILLQYSHLAKKDFDTAIDHLIALERIDSGTFTVGDSEYKVVAVSVSD